MKKFPKAIEDFGNMLVELQIKRHNADYSPDGFYYRSAVLQDIDRVEAAMSEFCKCEIQDRRAFSAFVALKRR